MTEYPYYPKRRPMETAASGKWLTARLSAEEDHYAAILRGVARHIDALLRITRKDEGPPYPCWANDWFLPFDGATLYGMIAELAPKRYIEVGSGVSTRFARQAIRDLGLQTRIVSMDPSPRSEIDSISDEVIKSRMEDVTRSFWEGIGSEDLLFLDNSHRSFPNSDVTVFFAEVLPLLPPGTVWGLHDIFLPYDYPEECSRLQYYNEKYLLLAYLIGGANGDEILLPLFWASSRPRLRGILERLWAQDDLFRGLRTHGSLFWLRRGGPPVTSSVSV